jgi:hypothetical protein
MPNRTISNRQQYADHILRQYVKRQYASMSDQAKAQLIIRSQQRPLGGAGASETASRGISCLAEMVVDAQTDAGSVIHNDRDTSRGAAVPPAFF